MPKFECNVDETRVYHRRYVVEAENETDAEEMAERGDTIDEGPSNDLTYDVIDRSVGRVEVQTEPDKEARQRARHWQMLGYTTVKMPDGSRYDFRGTDTKSLEEHAKDHRGRIFREQRWLDAVMLFLDGETVSDPKAIR